MALPPRRSVLLSVLLLAAACATATGGQDVMDLRPADERFAESFRSRDPLSLSTAFLQFDRSVAPAERPEVLARMWDAGGQGKADLRLGVLRYLAIASRKDGACWSEGLESRLALAAADPSEAVRRGVLAALFERFDPKLRGAILRFLDDPSDEIRAVALRQLAAEEWPEAGKVLQGYLQANGSDPTRAGSAHEARAGLARLGRAPVMLHTPPGALPAPALPPPPPAVQPVPERQPARSSKLGDD